MIRKWIARRRTLESREAMKQKLMEKMRPIDSILQEMHFANGRYLKSEKVGHKEDMNYYKGKVEAFKWLVRWGENGKKTKK